MGLGCISCGNAFCLSANKSAIVYIENLQIISRCKPNGFEGRHAADSKAILIPLQTSDNAETAL
jgi:hypothetical protein